MTTVRVRLHMSSTTSSATTGHPNNNNSTSTRSSSSSTHHYHSSYYAAMDARRDIIAEHSFPASALAASSPNAADHDQNLQPPLPSSAGLPHASSAGALPPPNEAISWRVSACAALGGLLFGYDTGIVNGAMFQLCEDFNVSIVSWESGAVVAFGTLGAFLGSAVGGFVADQQGRKFSVMLADICFIIGSFALAFSPTLWLVIISRVILGLGIGCASVVIPVYLAEITPAAWRGRMVTMNNVCITGGQLIAACIAAICVLYLQASLGWRIMFGLGVIPAAIQLGMLMGGWIPESPRWLWRKGRKEEADAIALTIGVEPPAMAPVDDSQQQLARRQLYATVPTAVQPTGPLLIPAVDKDEFAFSALLAPNMRRRLGIGCGLQVCQQLSGINTVMYYSAAILSEAGFSGTVAPVLWSVPLALTNALGTVAGIFTVDRWGRRPLLLLSLFCCWVAITGFSIVSFVAPLGETRSLQLIILLFVYLAAFSPGMGPVPWVVNSEIYPTHLRSAGAGAAAMMNWLTNALVSQAFPVVMGDLGSGVTFAVIAFFIMMSGAFVFYLVPETKGRTLEQIEEELGVGGTKRATTTASGHQQLPNGADDDNDHSPGHNGSGNGGAAAELQRIGKISSV